jgi:ankyrin repeat protein
MQPLMKVCNKALVVQHSSIFCDANKDVEGRTPLSWAAENGHEAMVRVLLGNQYVHSDSSDNEGRTPLSWASENGHEAVVKLLI